MSHRRWRVAVDAYVDGELAPPERALVAAHLAECWDCSSDAEVLRLVKHSLRRQRWRHGGELALRRLHRAAARLASPDVGSRGDPQ